MGTRLRARHHNRNRRLLGFGARWLRLRKHVPACGYGHGSGPSSPADLRTGNKSGAQAEDVLPRLDVRPEWLQQQLPPRIGGCLSGNKDEHRPGQPVDVRQRFRTAPYPSVLAPRRLYLRMEEPDHRLDVGSAQQARQHGLLRSGG